MSESQANEANIISKLNEDNGLAQRVRCGGCGRPVAMTPDKLTAANLVDIKGKKKGDGSQAKGILCNICLKDERVKAEGPRTAISVNTAGQPSEIYYDNLVDASAPSATETTAPAQGKKATK